MRKPLLALSLALTAGMGASPPAGSLAATPPNSTLSSSPPITAPALSPADTTPPNASPDAAGVSGAAIVQYAMKYLGYPYTATGNSPSTGFSCIGFVSYVYRSLGINLPGDLGGAMAFAPQVSFSDLLPGDILYFQNTVWSGLSHAAIYIGGGKFIHAEWYNRGVVISSFTNDPVDGNYWTAHYLGANRPWTGAALGAVVTPPTTSPAPTPGVDTTAPSTSVVTQLPNGPQAQVSVPSLNVRSGPSMHHTVQTVVTQGTTLVIIGHSHGWYKVALPGGAVGWVVGAGIGKGGGTNPSTGSSNVGSTTANPTIGNPSAPTRQNAPTHSVVRATVKVRVNGLRVHSSPGLNAPVVSSVRRGQHLPVLAKQNGWTKVQLPDGSIGWISSRFAPPRTHHLPKVSTTVTRAVRGQPTVKVATNVHATPSLQGTVVTVLAPGGSYQVLGWWQGWAHVRLANGLVGWISGTVLGTYSSRPAVRRVAKRRTAGPTRGTVARAATNVRQSPSLGATIVSVVPPGGTYQVLGWSNGWAHVRLSNGATGWISGVVLGQGGSGQSTVKRVAHTKAAIGGSVAKVATNVHSKPALSASVVSVVPPGGSYQVLGWWKGWAHVRLSNGATGWISGSILGRYGPRTKTVQRSARSSASGSVLTAGVRVHSAPGINAPIVGLAAAGTHVTIVGASGSWTEVRLPNGKTGYVLGIYVRS